jgi:hypothetical protein
MNKGNKSIGCFIVAIIFFALSIGWFCMGNWGLGVMELCLAVIELIIAISLRKKEKDKRK